jgi:hypothetical protein
MTNLKVFVVSGDRQHDALLAMVAHVPKCRTEVYTCPKNTGEFQAMPFIQVNGGERFYGKEGIEAFLAEIGTDTGGQ